jgi:hypothetical protein
MNIRFDPRIPNRAVRNGKNRPPPNCGMRISDCGLKKKTAKSDVKKIPLAHAGWMYKNNKIQ